MSDFLLALLVVLAVAQVVVLAAIGRMLADLALTLSISRQTQVYLAASNRCECPVCHADVAPEPDGRCPRCASPVTF